MKNRINVLIVEEDQSFSMYLALLLQRLGFRSLRVSQPEAAKFVVSRGFSDILIVGDRADSDPIQAIVGELAESSADNRMPTIVLSGKDDPDEQQACLEAGCSVYLRKPVQPKQLQKALYASIFPFAKRRLNLRSEVDLVAEVSIDNRPPEPLKVLSLSRGGALISYDRLLAPDTPVRLTLFLDHGSIPLNGAILYNFHNFGSGRQHAFGLGFEQPGRVQTDMIEDYLERILEQGRLLNGDKEPEPSPQSTARL